MSWLCCQVQHMINLEQPDVVTQHLSTFLNKHVLTMAS
ncbi:hypothetical protein JCM19237_5997 [Photobacterium aphoticum]|uniref:Uncharacterized protein n=1 Tax=Photobacterium aphoticum TaxID=754436 RepID=A0A090QMR8_9GAMM|nr:hypothetical protein JCM19237_5997 [Photobacterium aphoticum]